MSTKVQQTSHHPFKSLSDSDLSSAVVTSSSSNDVDKKRVTINDVTVVNDVTGIRDVTIVNNDVSFDSSSTSTTDQLKSKTLPSKGKQSLTLKRTNSLKRSITLPR
jgi:hypothetical protein